MKNILLILVGGTICTALNNDGNLSVSQKAGALIKENFINGDSPFAKKVNIEVSKNLFVLSENMTVDTWNKIIDTYREYKENKNYDGIIFAHGTDTLGFSAALFAQLLCNTTIPVFFVSANKPLHSEKSNGNANFKAAVECICKGISPNVYVVYKNISDSKTYLHLASRITQCADYSEDFFSSGMIDISDENCFEAIARLYPPHKRKGNLNIKALPALKECILMIEPYVGLNYDVFDYSRFSAVLHGTYHSGTACAIAENNKNSLLYMIKRCGDTTHIYLTPGENKKGTYETVAVIGDKVSFLFGTTRETAYAKLLIAYSVFDNPFDIKEFIETEHNFERIY